MRHTVCTLVGILFVAIFAAACGRSPGAMPGDASASGDLSDSYATEEAVRAREPVPTEAVRSVEPAPDFAFVLDTNPCGIGRADTFRGTFRQGQLWTPRRAARLTLSDADKARIYGEMVAIRFFDYPDRYRVVPVGREWSMVTPASRYYIKVRNAGRVKEVRWVDDIPEPNPPEARRLRELLRLMEDMIAARPEVRRLPDAHGGCL